MENVGSNIFKLKTNPRQRASFLSKIFFCWCLPLFVKGWKQNLNENDLYKPLKCHESKLLGDKLEEAWHDEVNRYRKPSLRRVLRKVYGKEIALFGLCLLFCELVLKVSQPVFIGKLLDYYKPNQTNVSKNDAYLYASCVMSSIFTNILIYHSYILQMQQIGLKLRVSTSSLIYRKSLKLSKSCLAGTTIGQLVNLLANDVKHFDMSMIHIHHLWVVPLTSILIIYLLYTNLGPTSLTGMGVLVFYVPLQFYLGKRISRFRLRTAMKTDFRIRLMNEVICGIQVIKMYTWEKPFAKFVEQSRKLEIAQIRGSSFIRAFNLSFMTFLIRITIFICILTYYLSGHEYLNAQYVFVMVSYYNILRQGFAIFMPQAIATLAETNISIKRIEQFLMYDEIRNKSHMNNFIENKKLKSKNKKRQITNGSIPMLHSSGLPVVVNSENVGIYLQNASAKWVQSATTDNTLNNINFNVAPKQLIAVVGAVGCGKTSLLHIILKELPLLKGHLDIEGTISYASQEPWLFAGSIRQNIVFGSQQYFNEERYLKVVKVCALQTDFALFPYGDRTIVGEKGVMLSGGQKARINLARAIYKEADIYLLDDPLSAVDAHVGKQLFDDCIVDFLKNKCIILVTHQIQYLKNVDRIYVMENGTITANGTFSEMQQQFESIFLNEIENQHDDQIDDEVKKVHSEKNLMEFNDEPKEVKEHKSTGTVPNKVYSQYVKAGGNWCIAVLLLFTFVLTQIVSSGCDYFLTFWVNLDQEREEIRLRESLQLNLTATNSTKTIENDFLSTFFTTEICLYVYSCLILFIIFLTLTRSFSFFLFSLKASSVLHNNMFTKILNAPMRFFNVNPSGRILNRFSKDIGAVDEFLPHCIVDTIQIGLTVLSITVVVSIINPWILIPTIIILTLFYLMRTIFLSTSRDVKRMEGTSKSPVFSHISASLQGLTTIRAFGAEETLKKEFDHHQDLHSSAFYLFTCCNRTFGFWLDMNCIIYIGLIIFSFLILDTETYGGNVGLSITQSIVLTGMLQWGMRQWSELENQMTAVERVLEYTEIQPEPDMGKLVPPKLWPEHGKIEFQSVSLKYGTDEPFVLKNLNLVINPEEKIGIVGRTGAGKTSIISVLFRLAHQIDGNVLIDKVNTADVPLKDLRSAISIIPQEPVLFSGTLRKNLDPFEEFDDEKLWKALAEVELKNVVVDLPAGLLTVVSEGGMNFSVGQRQLLCLARAIIRSNKILILDEATANVDLQTDELIQKTIRKKLKHHTVLTIAHRLHTVMDSDKILVMNAGSVAEFDHPYKLLQNSNGIFYKLVEQTGRRGVQDNLIKIAEESFHQRNEDAKNK